MTNKEAIEYGKKWDRAIESRGDTLFSEARQFLNLAIKALEERPQGDCISRSELMKAIGTMVEAEMPIDEKWALGLKYSLKVIDNAPTVETFTLEDMQNNFDAGVDSIIGKYDKARGEWIDQMATKGYVECPFCHKQITGGDLNFCVKCGADMRGGAENEEADE